MKSKNPPSPPPGKQRGSTAHAQVCGPPAATTPARTPPHPWQAGVGTHAAEPNYPSQDPKARGHHHSVQAPRIQRHNDKAGQELVEEQQPAAPNRPPVMHAGEGAARVDTGQEAGAEGSGRRGGRTPNDPPGARPKGRRARRRNAGKVGPREEGGTKQGAPRRPRAGGATGEGGACKEREGMPGWAQARCHKRCCGWRGARRRTHQEPAPKGGGPKSGTQEKRGGPQGASRGGRRKVKMGGRGGGEGCRG